MTIKIALPNDRTQLGTLIVLDETGVVVAGPFQADGKSDNQAAMAAGNPARNPEQPMGDTPLGEYTGRINMVMDSPASRRSYGQPDESGLIPIILLDPQPGNTQAWRAHLNHRVGLAIHCGDANGDGGLRSTHGCVRLGNIDFQATLVALRPGHSWQVSVLTTNS